MKKSSILPVVGLASIFTLTGCYDYFADVNIYQNDENERYYANVSQKVVMDPDGIAQGGYTQRLADLAHSSSTTWPQSLEECQTLVEEHVYFLEENDDYVPSSADVGYIENSNEVGCQFTIHDVPLEYVNDVLHGTSGTEVFFSHDSTEEQIFVETGDLLDEFDRFNELPAVAQPNIEIGIDFPGDVIQKSSEGMLVSEKRFDGSYDRSSDGITDNSSSHLIHYNTSDVLQGFNVVAEDRTKNSWLDYTIYGIGVIALGIISFLIYKRVKKNARPETVKFERNDNFEEKESIGISRLKTAKEDN